MNIEYTEIEILNAHNELLKNIIQTIRNCLKKNGDSNLKIGDLTDILESYDFVFDVNNNIETDDGYFYLDAYFSVDTVNDMPIKIKDGLTEKEKEDLLIYNNGSYTFKFKAEKGTLFDLRDFDITYLEIYYYLDY